MELQRMPDWLFEKLNPVMNKEQTEQQKQERQQKRLEYEQTKDMGETEVTIRKCLEHHSPNCGYDKWVKTGMIIKRELGDDSFEIWDDWSSKGDSYDPSIMEAKWNSFREDGELGIGTLIKWAMEAGMPSMSPTTPLKYHFVEDEDDDVFLKDGANEVGDVEQTNENPVPAEQSSASLAKPTPMKDRYHSIGTKIAGTTYKEMKEDFEKSVWKINNPFCYVRISGTTVTYINESTLKSLYQDQYVYEKKVKQVGNAISSVHTEVITKTRFTKLWLADEKKKCYETFVFDPSCKNMPYEYNTFNGLIAEQFPPIVSESKVNELVKPIIKHFDGVYGEEFTDYILKWLAVPIQRPLQKTNVAIIAKGDEGVGKDIVMDAYRERVIGSSYAYQTASPQEDLFGRFSNGVRERLFVCIDETKGKDFVENTDKLKNLITSKTIRYEEKNVMTKDIPNLSNFYFTTNNNNPIHISSSDRRYVAIKCKDTYHYRVMGKEASKEYFTKLYKYLQRQDVCRAFYQYLKGLNLTDCDNFQAFRPNSDYYKELQRLNLHPLDRFLSFYISTNGQSDEFDHYWNVGEPDVKASNFYTCFNAWSLKRNFNTKVTNTAFGRHMSEYFGNGIERTRNANGYIYKIDIVKLAEYMKLQNTFDSDVF
jgi:hypothetical protein